MDTTPHSSPEHRAAAREAEELRSRQLAARTTSIIGVLLVAAYAVLGILEIFVLAPLEGAPGRDLGQIYADLAADDELAPAMASAIAVISVGLLASAGVAVVTFVHRRMTWLSATFSYLGLLVLGAPAFALASFGLGMSLSDVYMNGGADFRTAASSILYGTSGAALLALIILCATLLVDAIRSSSPGSGSPHPSAAGR